MFNEFDRKNIMNCENCPYNCGHDGNGFDHRFPCDQQNCWIELNCAEEPDFDDGSSIGCKDCPDEECTGHCMSCAYRPI